MAKTREKDFEKKICDAALACAAKQSWPSLTHAEIAGKAKVPLREVKKLFPAIDDILPAIIGQTDIKVAAGVGKSLRGSVHDRLFEILMARFDTLQTRRPAILNILTESKRNPSMARHLVPAQINSMQKMLALAHLENQNGAKDFLLTAGLLTVYAAALYTWERDETKDMSKTMAALDRHLRRAGTLADILFRAF